jgi:FtsH-binding integral membrane protein
LKRISKERIPFRPLTLFLFCWWFLSFPFFFAPLYTQTHARANAAVAFLFVCVFVCLFTCFFLARFIRGPHLCFSVAGCYLSCFSFVPLPSLSLLPQPSKKSPQRQLTHLYYCSSSKYSGFFLFLFCYCLLSLPHSLSLFKEGA